MMDGNTAKRRSAPSEKILLIEIENSFEIISYLIQDLPEDVGNTTDDLLQHISKLKKVKEKYLTASLSLGKLHLNRGLVDNCKLVKKQRHDTLDQVSEYINLSNIYLSSQNVDEVSNLDIASVSGRSVISQSNVEDDLTSQLQNVNLCSVPENVKYSGKVDNLLESSSGHHEHVAVTFDDDVRPVRPVITSRTDITSSNISQQRIQHDEEYSPNVLKTSAQNLVNVPSPVNEVQSIKTYPYKTPTMPYSMESTSLQPSHFLSTGNLCAATPHNENSSQYHVLNSSSTNYPFPQSYNVQNLNDVYVSVPQVVQSNQHQISSAAYGQYPVQSLNNIHSSPSVNFSNQRAANQTYVSSGNMLQNNTSYVAGFSFPQSRTVPQQSWIYNEFSAPAEPAVVPNPHQMPPSRPMFRENINTLPTTPDPTQIMLNFLATQDITKNSISNFDGKSYMFRSWTDQINSRIQQLPFLSPSQVSHILLSNCSGPPHKMIETYLNSCGPVTTTVLQEIWLALEQRFGGQANLARDILEQLKAVKPIDERKDVGKQIEELHDTCKIVEFNIPKSPELHILNLAIGTEDIRAKLPEFVRNRWRILGQKFENLNNGMYPPFSIFVTFLSNLSRELNNKNYKSPSDQNRENKSRRVLTTEKYESSTSTTECPIHNSSSHQLANCKTFLNMSLPEKRKRLAQQRWCFTCMGPHIKTECNVEVSCEKCQGPHHTALHVGKSKEMKNYSAHDNEISQSSDNSDKKNQSLCTKLCGDNSSVNCSKTILVNLSHKDNPSVSLKAYAIIDEHSNCTLIDPKVLNVLHLKSELHDYSVSTVGGCESITSGRLVKGLRVKGFNMNEWIDLPESLTNSSIPSTFDEIATKSLVQKHHSISRFSKHFNNIDKDAEVLILIGRDCGKAMGTKCHTKVEPWVHETPLGWALVGSTCSTKLDKNSPKIILKSVALRHEHFEVNSVFKKTPSTDFSIFREKVDDDIPGWSVQDHKHREIMDKGVTRDSEGSVEVPLPFKSKDHLPCNRLAVFHRTKNTLQRLKTRETDLAECIASMEKSLHAGYVEQVPLQEIDSYPKGRAWWLPIFTVAHPRKLKKRLVYDASAVYHGTSLNDQLLTGPDMNHELRGILTRFREEKIGIVADIESMFSNFKVAKSDKDFLRFYWFDKNDSNADIVEYRAKSHVFGCSSSPACASYCLNHSTTLPFAAAYDKGRKFIQSSFYVDDGIGSCSTVPDAITMLSEAKLILGNCNIRLHKIMSNSSKVLEAFPPSERAEGFHSLDYDDNDGHRTLGVLWDPRKDCFIVNVNIPDRPFTKRGILSEVSSIFDPIGMVAPVVLGGRLIQRLVIPTKDKLTPELATCGWDDPLPTQYLPLWTNWKSTLDELSCLAIPRCLIPKHFHEPRREIHIFADASKDAIGYVMYMRSIMGDEIDVIFLSAGSRVAPRSAANIPRLELCAAVEASRCGSKIICDLEFKPERIVYYTDSTIVLGYINNEEKRFSRYVTNRVSVIHNLTNIEDWTYVQTDENPADIASRPCKPSELSKSIWLTGPDFLWVPIFCSPKPLLPDILPEQMNEVIVLQTNLVARSFIHNLGEKVSSWTRLLKVMQHILSLLNKIDFIRQKRGVSLAPRPCEVRSSCAAREIIKLVQNDAYQNQIKCLVKEKNLSENDILCDLAPFVIDGVLHVGGRLKNSTLPFQVKYPILLPPDHPITGCIVRYLHDRIGHQGRHLTHGEVRSNGYHIIKGQSVIRNILAKCVTCKKLRGKNMTQMMADLPGDRLEEVPPFTNCACDVFGHFFVSEKRATRSNAGKRKIWVLIFVCLVSHAVHLEPLPSLDTTAFRNALQRFICVRGTPKLIRSDNGTNIVATHSQMSELNIADVQSNMLNRGIEWLFNPPHASHFGGVYERKIGSIRRVMEGCSALLGCRTLAYDEFVTLLQEACAIVNNTPLCEVSDDPNDPMPLTPAALLTLRESPNPPTLENFDSKDILAYGIRRWRRTQYLAQEFWVRWRKDVIGNLHRRHKWKTRKPCVTVNDVVLVKDKTCKRNDWPMGRVHTVKRGNDGLVRTVTLELPPLKGSDKPRYFTRCIHDLVLLVPASNHEDECFNAASI